MPDHEWLAPPLNLILTHGANRPGPWIIRGDRHGHGRSGRRYAVRGTGGLILLLVPRVGIRPGHSDGISAGFVVFCFFLSGLQARHTGAIARDEWKWITDTHAVAV